MLGLDAVVEKTVNEFTEEASCEINKEELSSLEQEETIDQMGIEASCESHADMSDPALYIHSMEKLDLATRKRLISQGAFQPKAHEMNEKRFPTSRCGSLACVPVHSPVESGLCNILKFPVQPLSTKLVKFMHTSV